MGGEPILAGKTVSGPASARLSIDGQPYLNFYGCGYLALSNIPEIRAAAREALEQGAPFAQHLPAVLGATDPRFAAVQSLAAIACGSEASVYFSSGYLIAMVGLASLGKSFDLITIDELAHYSLNDAAQLSGLPTFRFAHCDVDAVHETLRQHLRAGQRPLLITDGVFATTGRIPPLAAYAATLADYDGRIFIDESHGFGVLGENGRGAAEHCGVEGWTAIGATLSKAFCAQGAIVACSAETALRLQSSPPIRGATTGSPLSAAAAAASLAYVAARPQLRTQLFATTQYLRTRLKQKGLQILDSPAPIVAFQCGKRADMLALQRRLFERGIYIFHSDYVGAGPEGTIRCAVFHDHSREDIDALIDALG